MMIRSRRVALLVCAVMLSACEPVTEANGDPVTIQWTNCEGSTRTPAWFAMQDGGGEWTRVNAIGTAVYTFTLTSGRGGVALYDRGGLLIIFGTSEELKSVAPACGGLARSVSGTVTGFAPGDNVFLSMGSSGTNVSGNSPNPASFTLTEVEFGSIDLMAIKQRNLFTATTQQTIPGGLIIRRGITSGSTASVDLNSATEGGVPLEHTVTVTDAGSGESLALANTLLSPTTEIDISAYFVSKLPVVTGSTTAPFYGLPSSRLVAGETQILGVTTSRQTSNSVTDSRFVNISFTDAVDKTVSLGSYLGTVAVSGTARPSAKYTIQPGFDNIWNFFAQQSSAAVNVFVTSGYAGTKTGDVTVAVPDLSGVGGFSPTWLLTPGVFATWGFAAADADLKAIIGKGGAYRGAQREATFTP